MPYDICCIGHVTADRIVTPKFTRDMPGGTALYFSMAVSRLPLHYLLITAVADADRHLLASLEEANVEIHTQPTSHTVCFENIYGDDSNQRVQRVSREADPFSLKYLGEIRAGLFHLGPLLSADISGEMIQSLAGSAKLSLDVQGLLRKVENGNVMHVNWQEKEKMLPYIHTLKANDDEAKLLTGKNDIRDSARQLANWGVREVVVTMGSHGSLILADGVFHEIPAYQPAAVIDATGCGDTYMAGYLYQRLHGNAITDSGKFAAAMATHKIEASGPFSGTEEEVIATIRSAIKV